MIKFNRTYTLKIGTESGETVVVRDPLTLDFAVQRPNFASLGTATFQIKNLGDVTRKKIYSDYYDFPYRKPIEFYAGYGSSQPLVFRGVISEASSFRPAGGVDNVTQIQAFMGSVGTATKRFQDSISGQVTQLEVIDRLINNLDMPKGFVSNEFNTVYYRGRSLSGYTWNLLKQETGGYCFIDNGKVYCMKYGDFLDIDVFLLNASTGLLGSPRRSKSFVVAEMLFEPRIGVGQRVQVQSIDNSYLNSVYTVQGIEHHGTISGAVGGQCVTKISMLIGASPLFPSRLIPTGVQA